MGNIWFTSDLHLGHANVIEYANRPFAHRDEMDQAIVANYRSVVGPKDTVYFLGDISFYKDQNRTIDAIGRLPGEKHLVFGNHDKRLRKNKLFCSIFRSCSDLLEISVPDPDVGGHRKVVLCHYAMRTWNKSHFGSYHLYGHSHGSLPDDPNSLSLDVGVDCWNFFPVSYDQVKERMAKKIFRPIDHHNGER